jgi:hypothetical protein
VSHDDNSGFGDDTGGQDGAEPGGDDGQDDGGDDGDGGDGGDDGGDGGDGGDDGDDTHFDVGSGDGDGDDPDDTPIGCDKVDFLFVIDNSGSMEEEQDQLIASFPGFVSAIEASVAVDDFHVMVTDVDESFIIEQCAGICPNNPEDTCIACATPTDCVNVSCADFPPAETCDTTIGAGVIGTPIGDSCGVTGGHRYMTSDQPDLDETFACVAEVGLAAVSERPMESMVNAVGPLSEPGACNEGFVRKDAILVVTVITDEGDNTDDDGIASPGDPTSWRQALVDAKLGEETAVVFLGLVGDPDLPGGTCPDGPEPEANPAPEIRELAESFTYGQWSSVCEDDYAPFFADAIAAIYEACDEFVPPP